MLLLTIKFQKDLPLGKICSHTYCHFWQDSTYYSSTTSVWSAHTKSNTTLFKKSNWFATVPTGIVLFLPDTALVLPTSTSYCFRISAFTAICEIWMVHHSPARYCFISTRCCLYLSGVASPTGLEFILTGPAKYCYREKLFRCHASWEKYDWPIPVLQGIFLALADTVLFLTSTACQILFWFWQFCFSLARYWLGSATEF